MIKAKIEECIRLTEDIMTEHFRGDYEVLFAHLHKNCLWIGSNASEYYRGSEMIRYIIFRSKDQKPRITLTSKSFECIAHERGSCAIAGRYIGTLDEDDKEIFRDMQRVTFLWREVKEKLYVWHMHISYPLALVMENEIFPHKVSVKTKEYFNMLKQEEIDKEGCIHFKDEQNTYQRIALSRIIYIERFDTNTIVHTTEGDIVAKLLLSEIEKQIKNIGNHIIVRVHRSYMVNKYHIDSIRRYELQMVTKDIVPISREKYGLIKKVLFASEDEIESPRRQGDN